jgi:hypothetical protein
MNLDRMVVVRGAAGGLILSMPAAMANVVFADQDERSQGLLALTAAVVVLGFVLAGLVAGLDAAHDVDRHGQAAASVTFVLVEAVLILGRLDRGAGISVPAIVIIALLALVGGTLGARLGAARRAKKETS